MTTLSFSFAVFLFEVVAVGEKHLHEPIVRRPDWTSLKITDRPPRNC